MTLAVSTGSHADVIAAAGWTLLIEYPKATKSQVWNYEVHYRFAHAATGRIFVHTVVDAHLQHDGSFNDPVDFEGALRAMVKFLANQP
jgi:hypothetical protein